MTYSEKLKDPRWQKKRLEILERDEWFCQNCGDSTETLHVHHLIYQKGQDPWDCENDILLTLCESCHQSEHESGFGPSNAINNALRSKGFLAWDFEEIAKGISSMEKFHVHDVMASVIAYALKTPEVMERLKEEFFKSIHKEK